MSEKNLHRLVWAVLFVSFGAAVFAQSTKLPEDADYASRLFSRQDGPYASGGETESQKRWLFQDDAQWAELNDRNIKAAEEFAKISAWQRNAETELRQSRNTVARHVIESRLKEIESRRTKTEPDGSTAHLGPFDFPELDGSTSCDLLGKIVAARVLGIPYVWNLERSASINRNYGPSHFGGSGPFGAALTVPATPVQPRLPFYRKTLRIQGNHDHFGSSGNENLIPMIFRIVADREKVPFRKRLFFDDHFGFFQGTHQSYMSLLASGIKEINESEMVSNNYAHHDSARKDHAFPLSEIILVARKPSADESAEARKRGIEFDVRPVARDALVFLVHRENPVTDLSVDQLRSIYITPKQENWKDFGGKDELITIFERNRNSGSREIMDELIASDEYLEKLGHPDRVASAPKSATVLPQQQQAPMPAKKALTDTKKSELRKAWDEKRRYRQNSSVSYGMMGPFLAIASAPRGISYSVHYYEHFMICVPQTRVIAVGGVTPSYETIRTKKYPLVSDVYVVTRKGIPEESPAARLRNWLLSVDGQRTIRESGYVPIDPVVAAE